MRESLHRFGEFVCVMLGINDDTWNLSCCQFEKVGYLKKAREEQIYLVNVQGSKARKGELQKRELAREAQEQWF